MNKEKAKKEIENLVEKYNKVVEENRVKEYNEEMTKKDFILPLFRALGWKVENSNEVTAEEKISKKRVDYGFRIGGIPKFFLEAKSLKVDLDEPKFFEQAVSYAWHKGCTWAVLTDFEAVKILNAEWKAANYLQSHFTTIYHHQFHDRFDELWLLSRESFEKGSLDKEAEKWGKKTKKTSVDRQLLADFTRFRGMLSKNITKLNQSKNLTKEELDESVQRILDRLIFIRNCEDRELEAKTLISEAREWRSKGKGQLIKSLRQIFASFDKGYDSEIFAKHLCDDLEIDSEVLYEIVTGLYYTKDKFFRISYDFSAIDADVLGNIYEQYLSHVLKKTEKRAKLTEAYAHRKEHGIYYTPTYIVDYIARKTLGELLKDEKTGAEKIRVLDPACGSGSFLIKAFDVLNEHFKQKDKDYDQAQLDLKMGVPFTRKARILQNSIFGVDLDKQAVEIARLNLLLKIAEKGHRLPLLKQNIKCGNSLIDSEKAAGDRAFNWKEEFKWIMDEGGFDIVIGNPPYIDSEEMVRTQPELREIYSKIYSVAKGNWDIFCIFLEKGLRLLKDGGFLGMIVPNKLLSADYALETRRIIQKYRIISIRDYSKIPVFRASVYPIVILIKKEPCKKNRFLAELMEPYSDSVRTGYSKEVEQNELQKTPQNTWAHIFMKYDNRILNKVLANSLVLDPECGEVLGAATVSEAYKLKTIIKELADQKEYFKFINTGTIDRYSSLWDIRKTRYIKASYDKPVVLKKDLKTFSEKRYEQAQKAKIIIGGITKRLECFLDEEGSYLAGKSTTIVVSDKTNLKIILALLNSKLMTFIYKSLFKSLSLQGGYMRIGKPQISKLPIKNIPKSQRKPLIRQVDKIIRLNRRMGKIGYKRTDERARIKDEIKKTDNEIDNLVYEIYRITNAEKEIIENSLK